MTEVRASSVPRRAMEQDSRPPGKGKAAEEGAPVRGIFLGHSRICGALSQECGAPSWIKCFRGESETVNVFVSAALMVFLRVGHTS